MNVLNPSPLYRQHQTQTPSPSLRHATPRHLPSAIPTMDIPSSMLSFLAANPPPSPAPEDLMFFFSSPATEIEDAPSKIPALHNPVTDPRNPQPHLDTLLQATSPSHHIYDPQPLEILPVNPPPKPEPKFAHTQIRSPSQSDSYQSNVRSTPRSNKRKRTLPVMKALAQNNAPDVSLSDSELVEIGAMHESEASLAQSKELYSSLLAFKQCLAKHGYRMTAVHLDPTQPNLNPSYSFDFVLNKKPIYVPATQTSLTDDAARLSNCTSETTAPPLLSDTPEEQPPRKRARTSQKAESSTTSHPPRLACAVCNKLMADIDTLVRHFKHAHQELKPFSCPRCKGFYSSEGTLWHHIRNVHTETPRKYKCSHCDASYDSFGAKTRHEHATHNTGTPAFVCSYKDCKRAFNFPAHLESHALQMHPGFRPFACKDCGKSFPSANGLTRHCREVHIRPQAYSCSCSKSYSKRCHLKRHLLRVHGMSAERVQEEMNKQPHPGLLHIMPPGPPASTE